jgi:hypothetical protein
MSLFRFANTVLILAAVVGGGVAMFGGLLSDRAASIFFACLAVVSIVLGRIEQHVTSKKPPEDRGDS